MEMKNKRSANLHKIGSRIKEDKNYDPKRRSAE